MLVIASPVLSLRLGLSDASNDPAGHTTRKAYDLLAESFGKGFNGPLLVVAGLPHANDRVALAEIGARIRASADVASVAPARLPSAVMTP